MLAQKTPLVTQFVKWIIKNMNIALEKMFESDLKSFYKSVYYFVTNEKNLFNIFYSEFFCRLVFYNKAKRKSCCQKGG